jgi:cytoskeleton protein RodZ
VERFKQEISGRHDIHAAASPALDFEGRRLPYGWRVVAGIVVLVLAYGAWHLLSAGPASQPVPPPPALNPPHAKPATPVVNNMAAPQPQAVTGAPVQPAPAAPAPTPPAQAQVPSPVATPTPEVKPATPASAATADAATPTMAGAAHAPAPAGHLYGAKNKNSRIVLRAQADTHVEVRGPDGVLWINRNLSAGDQYNVPNIPGLTLSASNAGALQIDLDGKAMGAAGTDQQAADNLAIDPQAVTDRKNGR